MRSIRGAVTVETAIVLAALLTFLLGTIQVGVVGFLQLTVDAGSFLNAHQTVMGVTRSANAAEATTKVFAQIKQPEIYATIAPAPAPSVYVDYGYNSTTPAVANASASNRHGGASILQPYLATSQISKKPFKVLGFDVNVQSTATEPLWFESGPHWDVANLPYGGTSSSTTYRADPYVDGTNTPPYYITQAFMLHCNGNQVFDDNCTQNDVIALGVGNNLNAFNENNTVAGISGPQIGAASSTFQTMACHQRQYAKLAQFFFSEPDLNYQNIRYKMSTYNDKITNFNQWNAYRVDAYGNPPPQLASDAYTAIRTIYSWDVEHGFNPPNNYQVGFSLLTPTVGC